MRWVNRRLLMLVLCSAVSGCRAGRERGAESGGGASAPAEYSKQDHPVRRVVCLFDQRPWISADAAGDRDPEGIQYRVYLDADKHKGVLRDGMLHIELYLLERKPGGVLDRTLASDWHYPTSAFTTIKANILGMGYHLQLRWGKKDIAGHEIELITKFEDPDGRITRAGTKRLRVPKYAS